MENPNERRRDEEATLENAPKTSEEAPTGISGRRVLCIDHEGRWHWGTATRLDLTPGYEERYHVDLDETPFGTYKVIPRKDMLLMAEAMGLFVLRMRDDLQLHWRVSRATFDMNDKVLKSLKPSTTNAAQRMLNAQIMERHIEHILRIYQLEEGL